MNIFSQLTPEERDILESVYGRQTFEGVSYNPHKLESVRDLTAREQKFFAGKSLKSAHFFIHTLYKVRGAVNPMKFTVTVNRMFRDNENLRVNFCDLGTRTVKVIRPAAFVRPEIIFRNMMSFKREDLDDEFEKICQADIRRTFDLKHDALVRFAIYKTGADEFALLLTMAQVIFDNFDVEDLFRNLADLSDETKAKKIPVALPTQNDDAARNYWANILNTALPTDLPCAKKDGGAYRQQIFYSTVPADLLSALMEHAKSNRMVLMTILQSAWGFMLQLTNKRRDCTFCRIDSAENDFSLNVSPVRLTVDDDTQTIEQIIRMQFRHLVVSKPYALSDWSALDDLTGQTLLFDHFLSFKSFTLNEMHYANYKDTPAEPLGKVIYQTSFDVQDMNLCFYLRLAKETLYTYFLYDAEKFLDGGVEKIYKLYLFVLQQLVADWDATFSEFMNNLTKRLEAENKSEPEPPENKRKKLLDFISQIPILQGRHSGTIKLFLNNSELVTFYEGDRISGNMLEENFIFVADGILSRNVDTGDGWYNTLDIIEKNAFVNPTNLLESQQFKVSVTILTNQAELLMIPHDVFVETLRKNTEVALSIIQFALEQMERYQILWLQT